MKKRPTGYVFVEMSVLCWCDKCQTQTTHAAYNKVLDSHKENKVMCLECGLIMRLLVTAIPYRFTADKKGKV